MKAFLIKHQHPVMGVIYGLGALANLAVVWWHWPDPFVAFSAFFAGVVIFAALNEFLHAWWLARVRREIGAEYAEQRKEFAVYAKKTIREIAQEVAEIHGFTVEVSDDGPPITRH